MNILISISLIISLFAMSLAWLLWRNQNKQWQLWQEVADDQQQIDDRIAAVEELLKGMSAGAMGQGNKLVKLEAAYKQLQDQMETLKVNEGGSSSYNRAIRLAKRGASVQELVADCEITETEADLIVRMHGGR